MKLYNLATPLEILQQYWGYPAFRPLQEDIIQAALDQKDCLALLPTGGGKSICFQIPALCQEGICIVVSPLIALMKDQVQQLNKRGINAIALHAGIPHFDIDRLLDNCVYGKVKFLYLSPERLHTPMVKERMARMQVNLFAVDEAHCISQWGYDFRPAYLEIAKIREIHPEIPIMALTASAIPQVVEDIQEKLVFRQALVFQKSFTRPNLSYVVRPTEAKPEQVLKVLNAVQGSAIIYVRNRRKTKEMALFLRKHRIKADFYHAGLDIDTRSAKQEAWIQNQIRVIVSTNAFGMGIDKPDVRLVIHLQLPDSLEAYYQEAGRAGRDGKKAFAVLLYHAQDGIRLEQQLLKSYPEFKVIRQVYRALGSYYQLAVGAGFGESFDFELVEFCKIYQLDPQISYHALRILESEGIVILSESFYNPASLKVRVSQDELYDFMLKHPKLDKVLKTILRSYQGAFQHHINIRESSVANFLKTDRNSLQKSLGLLHKEGIIDYRPQKDKPQLFFVDGRLDSDQLEFDQEGFRFRKTRQEERNKSAIAYAEQNHCRSQALAKYFGEEDAPKCGICDFCLAEKKERSVSSADFERYKEKIKLVLQREALNLQETLDSFAPKKQDLVLQVLEYIMDEGHVQQKDGLLYWKKPKS